MFAFLGRFFSKNPQAPMMLIVVLNLAVTIALALFLNIWIDEAYSLYTTAKDVRFALHQSIHFETQAPLYFVLLNLWRNFNHSIFFARLFSVLCITGTILLMPRISRRFFPEVNPVWLALVFAFNPFTIAFAVEIRCYALVILLSAVLIFFFYEGFLAKNPSRSAQLLYMLFALLGLYTQYYMGFLLVSNAIALLMIKRWRLFVRYIYLMVVVSVFLIPLLFIVPAQLARDTAAIHTYPSIFYSIKFIILRFEEYIFVRPSFEVERAVRWGVRCLVLGLLLICIGRNFQRRELLFSKNNIVIWTVVGILSLFFISIIKVVSESFLLPRHTIILLIPLLLLLFSALSLGAKKNLVAVFSVMIICLYGISLYVIYKPMAKFGDYSRVAKYVMSLERPGQKILLYPSFIALPLKYYYSGTNEQISIPRPMNLEGGGMSRIIIHDEEDILGAFCQGSRDWQNAWLITQPIEEILGVRTNIEMLEDWVSRYFLVEFGETFYERQTVVRFLRKKSDSRFDCK